MTSIRKTIPALGLFLALLPLSAASQAPLRGRALYQKLSSDRNLIKFEGESKVSWTPCGTAGYLFEKTSRSFVRVDAETGERSPLLDHASLIRAYNTQTGRSVETLPFRTLTFLDSGSTIRFEVGTRAFIYHIESKILRNYVPERGIVGVRGRVYTEVFSPDLKHRAFTRNYNLFVKDMQERERQLTFDGGSDLRNAFPDWVYPEEFGQHEAFWWSPGSNKIAFMQFDERPVAKYTIVHDVAAAPEVEFQSYPKAGANNPIIRFFIVDVASRKITRVETGMETNVYLYRGQWTPDGREFTYRRLNRLQNRIELWAADPETGKTRLILSEEDPCYIAEGIQLSFLSGDRFLWTSERSGWNEIYLYDMQGGLIRQVTDGRLPVDRVLDVDEEEGWIYFTGFENRGLESHFYRVGLDGRGFKRLTKNPGSHTINLSPGARFFTDTFSCLATPNRVTLHRMDGSLIRELGRSEISQEFQFFKLIDPELFTFPSADGRHTLDGVLYRPAQFDPERVYPLILSVYGGPGSKQVVNRFLLNDRSQALAQLGFLVLRVDHRGAARRGKAFQNLMYMNLGEIELADHVAGVRHITERPYADSERVGIFGHSYGGYLTCIAMLKAPDVFSAGVAGAPVTDWRNYDTIYTERYMRRPQDNPEGYRKGSCMTYAKNLKGRLAIHHGAVDDNVHPGNSVQLIQALLKHNKVFDFMLYPEQRHGIRFQRYGEARVEFFIRHLKPEIE